MHFRELVTTVANLENNSKIRSIGLSNFSLEQIYTLHKLFDSKTIPKLFAIQNHYNLLERDSKNFAFDEYSKRTNLAMSSEVLPWMTQNGIYNFPYHALCRGVLTDKFYKNKAGTPDSPHSQKIKKYENPRVFHFLNKVNNISKKYNTNIAAIAISWLRQEYENTIPVVSCNSIWQLGQLAKHIKLTKDEFKELNFLTH